MEILHHFWHDPTIEQADYMGQANYQSITRFTSSRKGKTLFYRIYLLIIHMEYDVIYSTTDLLTSPSEVCPLPEIKKIIEIYY